MAVYVLDVRLRAVNPTFSILPDDLVLRLCILVRIALARVPA